MRYDDWRKNFYTDPENEYFTKADASLLNNGKDESYRFNSDSNFWEHYERGKWKVKLINRYRHDGFDEGPG